MRFTKEPLVFFLLALSGSFVPVDPAVTPVGCGSETSLLSPHFKNVFSYSFSNKTMPTAEDCQVICGKMRLGDVAVEDAGFCYCALTVNLITTTVTSATTCTTTCIDGSTCGGSPVLSLYSTAVITTPTIAMSMSTDPQLVLVGTAMSISVVPSDVTWSWKVDWGDGAPIETGITSHTYKTPGVYEILVYFANFTSVRTSKVVRVHDMPVSSVVCPNVTKVFTQLQCNVTSARMGYGYILTYSIANATSTQSFLGYMPEEVLTEVGGYDAGTLGPSTTTLSQGYVLLGNSELKSGGFIIRAYGQASVIGSVSIYAAKRICATGTSYCGLTGDCRTTTACSSRLVAQSCAEFLCPLSGSCNSQTCPAGYNPIPGTGNATMEFTFLATVQIATVAFDFALPAPVWVPEGSFLAYSCLDPALNCTTPATLYYQNLTADEMVIVESDELHVANTAPVSLNARTSMVLVIRDHNHVNMTPDITCEAAGPVPLASVTTPFAASTEQYIYQSALSLTYAIYSPAHANQSVLTTASIVCQQAILTPTFTNEIWMRFGTPTPHIFHFPQGSPLFSMVDIDGTLVYDYYDNAILGYDWNITLNYAKQGVYLMTANTSNALGMVSYSTLVHVVPPVTDNWQLLINCPCYNLPDQFFFNATLSGYTAAVWNASVRVIFEQIAPPGPILTLANETLNFSTYNVSGYSAPINFNYTSTIANAALYTFTIMIQNEVSFTVVKQNVTIEEAIKNVTGIIKWDSVGTLLDGMGAFKNVFLVNFTTLFYLRCSKGYPLKWRVTINQTGEEIGLEDPVLQNRSHTFLADGQYTLIFWGYNTVQGWVPSIPYPIVVVSKLRGLLVTYATDIIKPGQPKYLTIDFEVFTPLSCVVVDFGDGSPIQAYGYKPKCIEILPDVSFISEITPPFTVNHNYMAEGYYDIRAIAFDNYNTFSKMITTVIADIACTLPTVSIVDARHYIETARDIWRSLKLRLETKAEYVCNKTVPVQRWWTITQVGEPNGESIKDVAVQDIVSSWNFSQLSLPSLFLEYGVYRFVYNFRLKASTIYNLDESDYTYVRVTKSPLSAALADGNPSSLTRGFGQLLALNASLSIDPDFPDNRLSLNYTWWCRQLLPTLGALPDPVKEFMYDYKGFNLHPIPTPQGATGLTGGGCFGKGDGTLMNAERVFTLNTASFVQPDATYQLILQVEKDTRFALAYLDLQVLLYPPPTVGIQCDPSLCYASSAGIIINPAKRLALVGLCTRDCPATMKYNWTITSGTGAPLKEVAPCEGQPPPPDDPNYECEAGILTSKTSSNFAVSPTFLQILNPDVQVFKIRLAIRDAADATASEGFTEMIVTKNKPPQDGLCKITTVWGYALLTNYPVVCGGWMDPEGIGIDYYSFYYLTTTNGITSRATIASSSQDTINLIFPVGVFELRVDAVDVLEGTSTMILGNVTAILPSQENITLYDYNSKIAYLSAVGDQTTLSMVLASLSSIRDNADWLSISDELLKNLSNTEVTGRLENVANLNKDQLIVVRDTMDFATLAQLEVGANVVQQALCGIYSSPMGALTVDMQTRDIAIELLDKMANKLSEVGLASPCELKSYLSKCMDAFSALIIGVNTILLSGNESLIPPTDQKDAVNWDYEADIGDNIELEIPQTYEEQVKRNVLESTRSKARLQVEQIYRTLSKMTTEIQKKSLPGEICQAHSEHGASIATGKLSEPIMQPGYVVDLKINGNAKVTFPENFCPTNYTDPTTDCKQIIDITIVVWPNITHLYVDSSKYLSLQTKVMDVDFSKDGKNLLVKEQKIPIILDIPHVKINISDPVLVNTTKAKSPHLPVVYHNFEMNGINAGYTLEMSSIDKADSLPDNMIILVDHKRMPIATKYLLAVLLKDFVYVNGTYSYFVNSIENKNRTGRFFVAVGLLTGLTDLTNATVLQKSNFDLTFNINYYLRVYESGCYYFNDGKWVNDGLSLLKADPTLITCSTVHLSGFAGGFLTLPNKLDFQYIFADAGFIDNLPIYTTLIIVTSVYVVMLLWGCFMDRRDMQRRGVTPLPDNNPEDKYLYEVTFYTGPDKDASTTSNIYFIASGDFAETEVRQLPPSHRNLYHRFDINSFVMAVRKPLGHINFLRVFHDNSGEPPLDSWQLQLVVFRDLQTSVKSIFHAQAWLAFDRGDGKVDRIFTSSEGDDRNFGQSLYASSNKTVNEDNLYMSMFMRPAGSRFDRKERATVCAVFLYLSMGVSAFFYHQKSDEATNGYFQYGIFSLSLEELISGGIILVLVYPLTIILSLIFKRARPFHLKRCRALDALEEQRREQLAEQGTDDFNESCKIAINPDQKPKPKDKSPVRCIPWWTRYLAWIVALALIGGSGFLVWSFGITWGETKTLRWLVSFLICFLISILITQWLKIIVVALITASFCKSDPTVEDIDCDEELPGLKGDEEWSNPRFVDPSLRKKVHRVEGVDPERPDVAAIRFKLTKGRDSRIVLKGIFSYALFLTAIYIMVNGRTNINGFLLQNHLRKTFIKEGHEVFDYSKMVITSDDWWNWAKNVILQELRAQRYYNNDPPYGLRGFMNDVSNRMLGYAIIRQVRTKRFNCKPPPPMDTPIKHCSGVRSMVNEETRDFCAGWRYNESFTGACRWEEFKYKTSAELGSFPKEGRLGTYGGGGYVFRLSGSQSELLRRMNDLQQNSWIDQNTKVVMLEFSIYNANVNLFSTCVVYAEFNDGGGILPKWRFEPVSLIKSDGLQGLLETLCELFFAVSVALSTLKELWQLKKLKCSYFDSYWNTLEISLLFASYAAIGLYFYRTVLTKAALTIFKETSGNGYVRIDSAVLVDQFFLYSISFIVFFSTLKLIKLLQFNKRMDVLALTIRKSWDELKIFLIAFAIVFFAFSCLFFFMFTSVLEQFAQILPAVQTSFQMMMGKFDFEAMNQANSLSPILFFVFSVINSMILINIMLTIILQGFSEVKQDLSKRENKLNIIDFVWHSFKTFIRKERLGKIDFTPVLTDKMDENSVAQVGNSDEVLPDKVSQLVKYINDVYFEGRLDLNDPAAKKSLMQGSIPVGKQLPFKDPEKFQQRKVLLSDD